MLLLLPAWLRGETGEEGNPAPALCFSAASLLCALSFTFADLIELNMALYASALLLEQAALLRLRWREPKLRRPYRIPLGRHSLALAYAPLIFLCLLQICYLLRSLTGAAMWLAFVLGALALARWQIFRPAPSLAGTSSEHGQRCDK